MGWHSITIWEYELRHTEKYTRAVDKLKEDAINSLPALNL